MVTKSTKLVAPKPVSYEIRVNKAGCLEQTSKIFSSEEINRLTPRGTPIAASREEVVATLLKAAKKTKVLPSSVIEASGTLRRSIK